MNFKTPLHETLYIMAHKIIVKQDKVYNGPHDILFNEN